MSITNRRKLIKIRTETVKRITNHTHGRYCQPKHNKINQKPSSHHHWSRHHSHSLWRSWRTKQRPWPNKYTENDPRSWRKTIIYGRNSQQIFESILQLPRRLQDHSITPSSTIFQKSKSTFQDSWTHLSRFFHHQRMDLNLEKITAWSQQT